MNHHHQTQATIECIKHLDKKTAIPLNFRDITVGASDDSTIATHLGMKHRTN